MKNKKIIIIVAIIAVCVIGIAAVSVALLAGGGEEQYRSIRVYELTGRATVERPGVGPLEAYVGMLLRSGDSLETADDCCLYLKLDDDKYALLEPGSRILLSAEGDSQTSKTQISLERGAMVNRLDGEIGGDSLYEVNSPNSTMAVRGTNFRIQVTVDQDGKTHTSLYVFEGTVACRLIVPGGSEQLEQLMARGGISVEVTSDSEKVEYTETEGEVPYSELSVETLSFLAEVIDSGVTLSIERDELAVLIEQKRSDTSSASTTPEVTTPAVTTPEETTPVVTTTAEPVECAVSPDGHHHYEASSVEKQPTCEEGGVSRLSCKHCGADGGTSDIPATGHTPVADPAVEADCTDSGLSAGSHCSSCGKVLEAQQTVLALGHDWSSNNGICANCDMEHACDVEMAQRIPGRDPDCTNDGRTDEFCCNVCGKTLVEAEILPAMGHDWSNYDGQCRVCGQLCQHDLIPTYSDDGVLIASECSICGLIFKGGEQRPPEELPSVN